MGDMNKWSGKKVCAVILAAGKSSRMGKFKPLLEIDGIPAVQRLIDSNKDARIDDIVIVTGHNNNELEEYLRNKKVVIAYNPDYEQGMFTSIRTGLKKAKTLGEFDTYFLFPVDIPLVPSSLIKSLSLVKIDDRFMVPAYQGKKGHPLVIPSIYYDEIINHDGTNGLKGITSKYDVLKIETDDESVVLDMDNPEDYEEMKAYHDKSKSPKLKKSILEESGFKGRLLLVRHGSTEQHQGKIFMGQVDIPLSDEGRKEALSAAEEMVKLKPKAKIIYSSLLSRGKETAEIINKRLEEEGQKKELFFTSRFNEMNLGDWDGKYIQDIKRDFPEEYKTRGENILTYKRYPDGENYYDLKYRVLKALKTLMANVEADSDLILVTHKGVINAIRENILGLDPMESFKFKPDRGSITVIDTKDLL